MNRTVRKNPSGRVHMGAAILAAAHVVDTELVKPRLAAFAGLQRSYAEAQRQLDAAAAQLREAQVQLDLRDAEQDAAIERLACALVAGGEPRGNPFAAFATAAPSVVKQMPRAAEAEAVHQLVAAVRRKKGIGRASLQAAAAAEQGAQRVQAALRTVEKCQQTADTMRRARDDVGRNWDGSLAALRRGARAAADDGAPGLYAALFGRLSAPAKKTAASTPTPPAPATPTVTPEAAAPPAANAA